MRTVVGRRCCSIVGYDVAKRGSFRQSLTCKVSSTGEYAFEMASSNIRFGRGATKEVGFDLRDGFGITTNVVVFTDPKLVHLPPVAKVLDSLTKAGVAFTVYDQVRVEPTDASLLDAVAFCRAKQFHAFVAVGGGSVMDTAKAANLLMCHPESDLLDFVNAPIGRGQPVRRPLRPLIAIPTTAGTGSETTGIAIFDHLPTGAKTGIRDRALKPSLGIVDPEHTQTCSPELTAFNGLDVLCHALESYTAVPFQQRSQAPSSPLLRPAYQGCNPLSDIWSGYALQQCATYLPRAVEDGDPVAREKMGLASSAAGLGFGNAGVHLCHAMSYPISSCVQGYAPSSGYDGWNEGIDGKGGSAGAGARKPKLAFVPHGLSVVLTAPAVFRWTASADPDKHLRAAALLGANVNNVKAADAGLLIADTLVDLLGRWQAFVPDGLHKVGYTADHLELLVKGTLPQKKVLDVSPKKVQPDDISMLLSDSMRLFT